MDRKYYESYDDGDLKEADDSHAVDSVHRVGDSGEQQTDKTAEGSVTDEC